MGSTAFRRALLISLAALALLAPAMVEAAAARSVADTASAPDERAYQMLVDAANAVVGVKVRKPTI